MKLKLKFFDLKVRELRNIRNLRIQIEIEETPFPPADAKVSG